MASEDGEAVPPQRAVGFLARLRRPG